MKKTLLTVVVIAILIIAVAVFRKRQATAPTGELPLLTATATPTTSPTAVVKPFIIVFSNNTAAPKTISLNVGDTVTFVNNEATPHWPASGVHPTHQICPGFDSLRGLKRGETYSFTFKEAKTCPWHDHLKPTINGSIVVNP